MIEVYRAPTTDPFWCETPEYYALQKQLQEQYPGAVIQYADGVVSILSVDEMFSELSKLQAKGSKVSLENIEYSEPRCYTPSCGETEDLEQFDTPYGSAYVCPTCKVSYQHQQRVREAFEGEDY